MCTEAAEIIVSGDQQLRAALSGLKAGDHLKLRGGNYRGGLTLTGIKGTIDRPVIIEALDPDSRPVFRGGSFSCHLVCCSHVTLKGLVARDFPGNGINVDDGGNRGLGSTGVILEDLTITGTSGQGNHDAIKLSGLDEFKVIHCLVEGWGGSGVDMVGCHNGVIENCFFKGLPDSDEQSGVQAKGGSSRITIRNNFFQNTGHRGVNVGGSTGLPYFRPKDARFEGEEIQVHNNLFSGGMAAVAFVNANRCSVRRNLIVFPEKWVFRVLQESRGERFPPCQKGMFQENVVVYDRRVRIGVNVGSGTDPDSFKLDGNRWYSNDSRHRLNLGLPEGKGTHATFPELRDGSDGLGIERKHPLFKGVGPDEGLFRKF